MYGLELKKISQLYRPVLMIITNYRFVAISSNLASSNQQCGKFCGRKPLKTKLVQELKRNNLPQRRIVGERALGKLAECPLLYRIIVFNDEAHFWLYGYVNIQNYRIWSDSLPFFNTPM